MVDESDDDETNGDSAPILGSFSEPASLSPSNSYNCFTKSSGLSAKSSETP